MGIDIELVHPAGVERGGAPLDTMNLITFPEQEFCEIGPVLAGDPRD
jgi:hypothetical protein